MANEVKFAILEENSVEYGGPVEHYAIAEEIFEDALRNRRVDELLYSHPHVIGAGKEVIVPSNQQLINIDGFEIKGQLTLTGSLVI